jgi:copper(I)-binding protein
MHVKRLFIVTIVSVGLPGCTDRQTTVATLDGLEILDAYAPAQPLADVGSLYFTVVNRSREPDTLIAVVAPIAQRAQLHDLRITDGRMQMTPVDTLPIPADGPVRMAPGGYHVMLHDLEKRLHVGDTIEVEATFAQRGTVRFPAAVLTYSDVAERLAERRKR